MQLPPLLVDINDDQPLEVLSCYYGLGKHGEHDPFTGSWFDTWDTTGHRDNDVDLYTADDLVTVTCLSVDVPAKAAVRLLDTEAEAFSALLTELGPDRDLATETNPWPDDLGRLGAAAAADRAARRRAHHRQQAVCPQTPPAKAHLRQRRSSSDRVHNPLGAATGQTSG